MSTVTSACPLSGREQAELTGQRLSALGFKYDVLVHSSMARATETANIISKHLQGSKKMPRYILDLEYYRVRKV